MLSLALVATLIALPLSQAAVISNAIVSGKSTFYGGNLSGGTCSFNTYSIPSSVYGVAFSGSAWDSAANCGACIKVTGPSGNSVTAMVSHIFSPYLIHLIRLIM